MTRTSHNQMARNEARKFVPHSASTRVSLDKPRYDSGRTHPFHPKIAPALLSRLEERLETFAGRYTCSNSAVLR